MSEGELRVGLGVDAHALEEGVPLVLGGLRIESPRGLAGHSDGDVIVHALIDAILGAAGMGDIGSLFPSDGGTPPGVSSLVLLEDAYSRVRAAGCARSRGVVTPTAWQWAMWHICEENKVAP